VLAVAVALGGVARVRAVVGLAVAVTGQLVAAVWLERLTRARAVAVAGQLVALAVLALSFSLYLTRQQQLLVLG